MSEPTPSAALRGDAVRADALVAELVNARLVGVLATSDPDGVIHAVPMWYAGTDGAVVFATSSRSRKVRNLESDSRATLVLHDSRPGYEVCGASIVGVVEVIRSPEALRFVRLVHSRYLTAEAATDPRVRAFIESDDAALVLRPVAASTWDHRASEATEVVRSRRWALPLETTDPRR